ncbi:hypothetical protein REH65_33215 (plasmid) [Saccharopolyspora sp. ID03-671]|uniref:hypothetical protein n=1 Tax=Saccharopolyspora sp. ID03-671 TaxID=3073066 RepID=UPI0030F43277
MPLRTVHCGPCWAAQGGVAEAAEIGPTPTQALGNRDPRSQVEWLESLAAEEWVQTLQLRTRRRLYALAHCLAAHADWETWESWPTWERLCEATRWARSTMAGWLRQLRVTGWLATIEHGSTPRFRPMGLADVEGNRAAVYALRVPVRRGEVDAEQGPDILQRLADLDAARQRRIARRRAEMLGPFITTAPVVGDKTWTPTLSPSGESVTTARGSYARVEIFHKPEQKTSVHTEKIEALRARFEEDEASAFAARVPVGRAEMLAAACELRSRHDVLARLSARWIRSLCRPYWLAGWTNHDVLHALQFRPTSWSPLPAMPAERVVAPARWIEARLAAWRNDRGQVLPGRQQHTRTTTRLQHVVGRAGLIQAIGRAAVDADVIVPDLAIDRVLDELTPEAIRERGRQAHQKLTTEHAHQARVQQRDAETALTPRELAADDQARAAARAHLTAELQQRATARSRSDELRRELVRQAHERTAAQHQGGSPATAAVESEAASTPEERRARAMARARREARRNR